MSCVHKSTKQHKVSQFATFHCSLNYIRENVTLREHLQSALRTINLNHSVQSPRLRFIKVSKLTQITRPIRQHLILRFVNYYCQELGLLSEAYKRRITILVTNDRRFRGRGAKTVAQNKILSLSCSFSHPVAISYAFCSHHDNACRG